MQKFCSNYQLGLREQLANQVQVEIVPKLFLLLLLFTALTQAFWQQELPPRTLHETVSSQQLNFFCF